MGLDTLKKEIIAYRRELPRLLAEGQGGRFVLIKGDDVLGVWETFDDACQAGYDRFGLGEAFLAQPVDAGDLTRPFPSNLSSKTA